MPPIKTSKIPKHLPTRCGRAGYKAGYTRYTSEKRYAKNKARRIVRSSLCSQDPRKIATHVAKNSPGTDIRDYVERYLKQRGL